MEKGNKDHLQVVHQAHRVHLPTKETTGEVAALHEMASAVTCAVHPAHQRGWASSTDHMAGIMKCVDLLKIEISVVHLATDLATDLADRQTTAFATTDHLHLSIQHVNEEERPWSAHQMIPEEDHHRPRCAAHRSK